MVFAGLVIVPGHDAKVALVVVVVPGQSHDSTPVHGFTKIATVVPTPPQDLTSLLENTGVQS